MDDDGRFNCFRYLTKMTVMREVHDLTGSRHARQQSKRLFGTEVVERLRDVVGEKRGRLVRAGEFVVPGDS